MFHKFADKLMHDVGISGRSESDDASSPSVDLNRTLPSGVDSSSSPSPRRSRFSAHRLERRSESAVPGRGVLRGSSGPLLSRRRPEFCGTSPRDTALDTIAADLPMCPSSTSQSVSRKPVVRQLTAPAILAPLLQNGATSAERPTSPCPSTRLAFPVSPQHPGLSSPHQSIEQALQAVAIAQAAQSARCTSPLVHPVQYPGPRRCSSPAPSGTVPPAAAAGPSSPCPTTRCAQLIAPSSSPPPAMSTILLEVPRPLCVMERKQKLPASVLDCQTQRYDVSREAASVPQIQVQTVQQIPEVPFNIQEVEVQEVIDVTSATVTPCAIMSPSSQHRQQRQDVVHFWHLPVQEKVQAQQSPAAATSAKREILASRLDVVEKELNAGSSENIALTGRVASAMQRLDVVEKELESFRMNTDNAISALQDNAICFLQQCESLTAVQKGSDKEPAGLNLRFDAKVVELQEQLSALDTQGRDIFSSLKEQAQTRSQFEETVTRRLDAAESQSKDDFLRLQQDLSKLREAFDIETMVREDSDHRLQAALDEADSSIQELQHGILDISRKLGSIANASSVESQNQLLQHIEEQLKSCARDSERDISVLRKELLGLQETLMAEQFSCSTSSLLRRVVALEQDQDRALAQAAQQLADERRVHETEACIHREETIRALREERELCEQSHMHLERRIRVDAEAQSKEKERRKEVEYALDRRITDISNGITEVRQHVRLLASGVETAPATRSLLL